MKPRRQSLGELWRRYWFHLSTLALLAPAAAAPIVLRAPFEHDAGRVHAARAVGPWTVTLTEAEAAPPYRLHSGRRLKDYGIRVCDGCREQIRGAFLAVGEHAPPLDTPGFPLHGSQYHLEAHVEFPDSLSGRERLWLTVDGWTGEAFQTSWPLEAVGASSPRSR